MASAGRSLSYPRAAYNLSSAGGVFIFFGGAIYVLAGIRIGPEIPFTALVLGVAVMVVAWQFKRRPVHAKVWGGAVVVLSLLSYLGGAGLVIGLVLGVIGGIVGIAWKASTPAPGYSNVVAPGAPAWVPASARTSAPNRPPTGRGTVPHRGPRDGSRRPSSPLPPAVPRSTTGPKFCTRCGSPGDPGARFCAICGNALAP